MTETNLDMERNDGTSTTLADRVKQASKDFAWQALETPGVVSAATGFALGYAGREIGGGAEVGLPGAPVGLAAYNGLYPKSLRGVFEAGAYATGVAASYADQITDYTM